VLNALKKYGDFFVTQCSFTECSQQEFENIPRDNLVDDIVKVLHCNAGLHRVLLGCCIMTAAIRWRGLK
jgi:hypothetical protein